MRTSDADNTGDVTDLRTLQAEQPGCFIVAEEHFGNNETRLYGPFATREDAQAFGEQSFGGADYTGGVRWMVYGIDAAVDQFMRE
jgi:hypothetical protein